MIDFINTLARLVSPVEETRDPAENELEARKLYHVALMEEYKALRAESVADKTEYKKVTNITIVSFTVLAALYKQNEGAGLPAFYLFLGSNLYGLLALYILRHMWHVICIGNYQIQRLAPAVRDNLQAIALKPQFDDVLDGESKIRASTYRGRLHWFQEASTMAIPLLPSVFLFGAGWWQFFLPKKIEESLGTLSAALTILIGIVPLVGFIYVGFVSIKMRKSASSQSAEVYT